MHATYGPRDGVAWVRLRATEQQNMPPVYHCGMLDFGSLPADAYDALSAWVTAGGPGAASWPP
jgi:hypothetical protein